MLPNEFRTVHTYDTSWNHGFYSILVAFVAIVCVTILLNFCLECQKSTSLCGIDTVPERELHWLLFASTAILNNRVSQGRASENRGVLQWLM